jgi:hypothetical protein
VGEGSAVAEDCEGNTIVLSPISQSGQQWTHEAHKKERNWNSIRPAKRNVGRGFSEGKRRRRPAFRFYIRKGTAVLTV